MYEVFGGIVIEFSNRVFVLFVLSIVFVNLGESVFVIVLVIDVDNDLLSFSWIVDSVLIVMGENLNIFVIIVLLVIVDM